MSEKKYLRIINNGNHQQIIGYKEYLSRLNFHKKNALLSYLTAPVIEHLENKHTNKFSNPGIALAWAKVLNKLGYTLDIIDWSDQSIPPREEYDLLIFHGGKNFSNIWSDLQNKPQVIYFGTGSYWEFSNQAEDNRLKDFGRRHKIKPRRDRYVYDSESIVNKASSGIIVLGDPSMKDTFPDDYPPVITINNASFPDDHFDKTDKDYAQARKNFLFFAGSGNIHKGLDLLLDSFKDLDEHLYIVTSPDKIILSVFKQVLKLPNIHLVGEVGMRDPLFYEVMDKCAYVVLPSCSEGQAGSVVEAMNQGLIPIVSKETRLDARGYGVVLENNRIETISKTVQRMSALKSNRVEEMAKKVRKVAIEEHSPEEFRKNLKKAIQKIVKNTDT